MNSQLPKSFSWVNNFKKYSGNPIIRPQGEYAADLIFNPAAIQKDGQILLLCRCVNLTWKRRPNDWSVSSLVWARSNDGINFTLDEKPFLISDENCEYTGGYEDPRLVYIPEEELYLLTYTGVKWADDGKLIAPGMLATSKDLVNWEFHGEKFPYRAVCITNKKINGKYWAYHGHCSKYASWSYDLINWHHDMTPVISPREGYFDERVCEGVAAPIISDDGILLLYNGATSVESTKKYAAEVIKNPVYANCELYSVGWVLFDKDNPTKVIARSDEAFLSPTEPFETYGFVNFTIFASGLVDFQGKKHIYYGCCDNKIGVAIEE